MSKKRLIYQHQKMKNWNFKKVILPSEISFSDNTPSPFLSRDLKRFERLMISASESYEAMNVKATFLSLEFEEKLFILFHSIPFT